MNYRLYLVTDGPLSKGRSVEHIVEQALRGGVSIVQLREKNASTLEFIALAERVLHLTRKAGVPCLINDRLDVAMAVDADGVHLGQQDMPYETARRLLGKEKIIGLSVESVEQARAAQVLDVDYIGISPIYLTPTKNELQVALGLEGLRAIRSFSRHPLVAIGGLNLQTIPDVICSGADGIAVVSAICSADDPCAATVELRALIETAMQEKVS